MKFEIPQEPLKRLLDDPRILWFISFYRHVRGDTDWQDASLQNSWVNYGGSLATAQYRLKSGIVFIKGTVKSGIATSGTVIFTLPEGYRPAEDLEFECPSNGAAGQLDVQADGDVVIQQGTNPSFGLTCSFIAEQ